MRVRVNQMRYESETVLSLELVAADGAALPPYEPGAHIDIELSETLRRSYSLFNLSDGRRYCVAVHRDANGAGGSRHVHDHLRVGHVLSISRPLNNFALDEGADQTVLVAGGIGVTPLLCMARKLAAIGARWTLHYAARSRAAAAFLDALRDIDGRNGRVVTHFDDEAGRLFDVGSAISGAPRQAHFYGCGPAPMLSAFKAATAARDPSHVHIEYFSAEAEADRKGGFEVTLARQGRSLLVPEGKTILEVLIDAKVNVPYSCADGVCGTCETRVLQGVPDHRDSFLSDEEKAANATMMVCCSGAKTKTLVLDL